MKVFDLQCEHGHRFEGWFASASAYDDQSARGLLQCPVCSSAVVYRLPSAPYLNMGATKGASQHAENGVMPAGGGATGAASQPALRDSSPVRAQGTHPESDIGLARAMRAQGGDAGIAPGTPEARMAEALQAAWLKVAREVIRQTENVGDAFADEARRIHYQEAPARAIRGQATADEVAELADEGIDVLPLPIPDAAKETLQ